MIGERPVTRTRLPVVKVAAGHDLELCGRSADVLGVHVHWLGKRSFICPDDGCPACAQYVGSKWLGLWAVDFFAGVGRVPGVGLIELTEGAYAGLRYVLQAEGVDSLFGVRVVAERRSRRAPLRFHPVLEPTIKGDPRQVIESRVIADAAATLFGLPSVSNDETLDEWVGRAAEPARRLIAGALARLMD